MTSPIRSRVAILAFGVSLLAAAVGGKLVYLQVLRADEKRALADRQHRQTIEIDGPVDYVLHFASPASPIALAMRAAATEESTPPLTAHKTFFWPTLAWIDATASR